MLNFSTHCLGDKRLPPLINPATHTHLVPKDVPAVGVALSIGYVSVDEGKVGIVPAGRHDKVQMCRFATASTIKVNNWCKSTGCRWV
jgi:hypothetical protein